MMSLWDLPRLEMFRSKCRHRRRRLQSLHRREPRFDQQSQLFMQSEARRGLSLTGVLISTADAESFVRGSADAGLLRILA